MASTRRNRTVSLDRVLWFQVASECNQSDGTTAETFVNVDPPPYTVFCQLDQASPDKGEQFFNGAQETKAVVFKIRIRWRPDVNNTYYILLKSSNPAMDQRLKVASTWDENGAHTWLIIRAFEYRAQTPGGNPV